MDDNSLAHTGNVSVTWYYIQILEESAIWEIKGSSPRYYTRIVQI